MYLGNAIAAEIPLPQTIPRGPRTIKVASPVINKVNSGFVKNLIGLGETLSAIGSTKDINQTPKIIGITEDE